MSLIRRETTEAMAAASRANGQLSIGPVTPAGKLRARMNALRHGLRAELGQVIPQLGESEDDLLELRREHERRFRPRSPAEFALIAQMVENRWRRRRLVRGEAAVLVAQQLRFDVEYGRAQAADGRSSLSAGEAKLAQEKGLAALLDSTHKFRFILQCLQAARRAVETEGFGDAGLKRLEAVYGPEPGLAGAALLANYRDCQKAPPHSSSPATPEDRGKRTDFLALLDSEMSEFQTLQELHEISRNELAAAERETLNLLPSDRQRRILSCEEALDRQYERFVGQFEDHRKERRAERAERNARFKAISDLPVRQERGSADHSTGEMPERTCQAAENKGQNSAPPLQTHQPVENE
jgi:hypothetical protein